MKEESNSSESNDVKNIPLLTAPFEFVDTEALYLIKKSEPNAYIKQENVLLDKSYVKPSHSSFSWPSLWKNGPRRSAFQPYKPSTKAQSVSSSSGHADYVKTESPVPTEPRPASTTVMTNLQRGNIQSEATLADTEMSWFTLVGRGDITAEQLQEMINQGKNMDCVDEEGLSGLMWAAFHGQIHTVQILLEVSVEVDREGMWGETALMLAATEGHLEIVRLLIDGGADVNHEDHSCCTPLMCAVYGDHPHTVNELLINGAQVWVQNSNNSTAYDIAVDQKSYKSKAVLEKFICSLATGS